MGKKKENYFFGFRSDGKAKFEKLLGITGKSKTSIELKSCLEGNIFIRSIGYLKLKPTELLDVLEKCAQNGTKFVCLKEGFCFNGEAKTKKLRHASLFAGRSPEIGQSMLSMLRLLDMTFDEGRRREGTVMDLVPLIGKDIKLDASLIAQFLGITEESVDYYVRLNKRLSVGRGTLKNPKASIEGDLGAFPKVVPEDFSE